jgi:hypothetical protein
VGSAFCRCSADVVKRLNTRRASKIVSTAHQTRIRPARKSVLLIRRGSTGELTGPPTKPVCAATCVKRELSIISMFKKPRRNHQRLPGAA